MLIYSPRGLCPIMDSTYLNATSKAPGGLFNTLGSTHASRKAHHRCSLLTGPNWGLAQLFFAASYVDIVIYA